MALYGITLLLSVIRFPKYYDTPVRYLPVLLAYTLLTEAMGMVIRDNPEYSLFLQELYYNNNWLIFNIFSLIYFGFYFYVYYHYLRLRWILPGVGLYGLAVLLNAFLDDFRVVSQVYSYGVGSLLLIPMAFIYLKKESRNRKNGPMGRNLLVWLSSGVLLFQAGYTPIKLLRYLMVEVPLATMAWVRPVHLGLIHLMYALFIAGLLVMKKMKRPGPEKEIHGNGK